MLNFAKLDITNTVTAVITVGDDVPTSNGPLGENPKHVDGEKYCNELLGGNWKQYSQTGEFRQRPAVIGGTYDEARDVFIAPKPYISWILDENNNWVSPTPMPTNEPFVMIPTDTDGYLDVNFVGVWNEANQRWEATNKDSVLYIWNNDAANWVVA